MDARATLSDWLRADRDALIGLVQALVRIPSENPPGDTTAVFAYLTNYLTELGFAYEVVAPNPTMPNIVATVRGAQPGRHLVLNGHCDVFPAGDPALWSDPPFSGTLRNERLYGRGVSDMKAGVAILLTTFRYLAALREQWSGALTLTLVSDEETFGPYGSRHLVANHPDVRGDVLFSAEPSAPGLVRFGEKGFLWLDMRTTTQGGHGGYPQVSVNAIKEIAAIINDLESLAGLPVEMPADVRAALVAGRPITDRAFGAGATDVLQAVTVNIGTIGGGHKVNMIANQCRTEVDIRCPIGTTTEQALQRVEAILEHYPNTTYTIINRGEPDYSALGHPFVELIQQNCAAVRSIQPVPAIGLGATDCRLWRAAGIPAFVYGPTPYNMGAPDEHVVVEDLLAAAAVHVLTAFDYLSAE